MFSLTLFFSALLFVQTLFKNGLFYVKLIVLLCITLNQIRQLHILVLKFTSVLGLKFYMLSLIYIFKDISF